MAEFLFPIIGWIDETKEIYFKKLLPFLINKGGNDSLISYVSTPGGNANISTTIASIIRDELSMETIAYAGNIVFSGGGIIFSAFKKRIAFEDSKFLIHSSIPPKGMKRTEIFDLFDQQIWEFISYGTKVSLEEISKIGKRGKQFSAQKALEIGLVHEIINCSWKKEYRNLIFSK